MRVATKPISPAIALFVFLVGSGVADDPAPQATSATNVLAYDIGHTKPDPAVVVTTFNDFSNLDWDPSNSPNAFQKIFGRGELARTWHTLVKSEPTSHVHPRCNGPSSEQAAALKVETFMKPYDIYQGTLFLPAARKAGHNDFLPAAARRRSTSGSEPPYMDDLACPTTIGESANASPEFLRTTYGQAAIVEAQQIRLVIDNAFNPFRWDGNVGDNRIMHREQSSLGLAFNVRAEAQPRIRSVFRAQMQKDAARSVESVILSYDLDVAVSTAAGVPSNEKLFDLLDRACTKKVANEPQDLFEASICPVVVGQGQSASWRLVKSYLRARLLAPSIQLSIGVVLDPGGKNGFPWREQEFMVAHYNYGDSHPAGFAPTANETLNAASPIGNSNGRNNAWLRTRISAFNDPSLVDAGFPIVNQQADDWRLDAPTGTRRLRGRIDLTNYVRNFSRRNLLPGMSGEWAGCSSALPVDIPIQQIGSGCGAAQRLATVRHGSDVEPLSVYKVLVVPEVHGPFRVAIALRSLRLSLEKPVESSKP